VAVAASVVLIVGSIPLAIMMSNRKPEVAVNVHPVESVPRRVSVASTQATNPVEAVAVPAPPIAPTTSPSAEEIRSIQERNLAIAELQSKLPAPSVSAHADTTVASVAPSRQYGSQQQASKQIRTGDIVYGNVVGGKNFHGSIAANGQASRDQGVQNQASRIPVDPAERIRQGAAVEAPTSTETYAKFKDNEFLDVVSNPLSTFSIDVDTASYSTIRRFIKQNQLPPKEAVRIEEMLNYFPYEYAAPKSDAKDPIAANVEVADCPWTPSHRLVRVALKGKQVDISQRPPSNLVFLVDVSGSMQPDNKLPLLKECMKLLVQQLDERDRVAIVVYAGNSGLALPSTMCANKQSILDALDALQSGGSTNGAGGIELAYQTAVSNYIDRGTNRVILCTDGDFNVGISDPDSLQSLIEQKARSGVFLSVLGFGMGNTKDATMERLADKGNGNYAYIDSVEEGRKVLVEQMSGTLLTIAKDVKIQIEFNPTKAQSYRLIGYENRILAKEDFNDDKKDAGDMGAAHTVTVLYEVVPANGNAATPSGGGVDPLKYQKPSPVASAPATTSSNELMTLKIRYKEPAGETSKLMEVAVTDSQKSLLTASVDFRFAAAVAELGMILRGSPYQGTSTYASVIELADASRGTDPSGYRREFVELVRKARTLANQK
jgi:Ca-activated chloride channel family protein